MKLIYRRVQTRVGELLVAVGESGVCRISFPVELMGKWYPWFDRYFAQIPKAGQHALIDEVERQIEAYLSGTSKSFDLPFDLRGTEFQLSVWNRLLDIPYGSTVTYGELAKEIGIPGGSRAIGGATGANPLPLLVPCHRVVGLGGNLVGFGGGIALKERLLELEGARIPFR
jgi:O-6-methylguanine DNA methyltransferase